MEGRTLDSPVTGWLRPETRCGILWAPDFISTARRPKLYIIMVLNIYHILDFALDFMLRLEFHSISPGLDTATTLRDASRNKKSIS